MSNGSEQSVGLARRRILIGHELMLQAIGLCSKKVGEGHIEILKIIEQRAETPRGRNKSDARAPAQGRRFLTRLTSTAGNVTSPSALRGSSKRQPTRPLLAEEFGRGGLASFGDTPLRNISLIITTRFALFLLTIARELFTFPVVRPA
jgi:hypothetical protein